MHQTIETSKAAPAIGPYSQAVSCNGLLFTSGQIPVDAKTGEIVGTEIHVQTEQVMKNISAILEEAGTTFDNVIKTTCFIEDIEDFAAFNEVYGEYFVNRPVRSCVAVKTLPKNVLCEVEVVAEL